MAEHSPTRSAPDRSPALLAQQGITFISKCRLPPTPKVYEVWYRFFEGDNKPLVNDLAFRLDDPESIKIELIESLHAQHCVSSGTGDRDQLAFALTRELSGFQSIIADQKTAGNDYAAKLESACKVLEGATPEEVIGTAGQLNRDTKSMQAKLEEMQQRVEKAERQTQILEEQLRSSQAEMMSDHLTGVGNRRFYESLLVRAINRVDEEEGTAYLLLVDCDRFKSVNDTFGHPFGDEVIKLLAKTMQEAIPNASISRLGGDEFAAFIRCGSVTEVEKFAEDLRHKVTTQQVVNRKTGESLQRLTLSIGVAPVRRTDDTSSWHDRADRLLYEAKRLGGNRVVLERRSDA